MSVVMLLPLGKMAPLLRPTGCLSQSVSFAKTLWRHNNGPSTRFSGGFSTTSRQFPGKPRGKTFGNTSSSTTKTATTTTATETASTTTSTTAQAFANGARAFPSKASYARRRAANFRVPARIRVTRVKTNKPAELSLPIQAAVTKEVVKTCWWLSPPRLTQNAMVLRFSNENSYLNWARNGVLSSAVGVAMYAQEHHRGAQLSGAGLLLLGFGFLGVGTLKYIFYILRFRQMMQLSWGSVIGTVSHASVALIIWLMATASFLESVPLELDAFLLTEPIASYLPFRIRQGLIETYSLYLDDLEHQSDEEERVMRAIRGEKDDEPEPELP